MSPKLRKVEAGDLVEGRLYKCGPKHKTWKCKGLKVNPHSKRLRFTAVYAGGGSTYYITFTTERYFYEVLEEGEAQMTNNELYQIKDTDTYGTILATNSQGLKVFEVRGTGEVKTVKKEDLEEVIPYTVGVRFLESRGNTHDFFAEKGVFEVGDIIFNTSYSGPMVVTKLNTKSKSATKYLEGSLIRPTTVVKAPE